jgi:hypothetical protein
MSYKKAVAYTTIRLIGTRTHPLIAVNYFASWCAVVSLASLLFIPSIGGIVWPTSAYQWALLAGIGVSGFVMQFCLTAGFQLEKVGRGANMVRILISSSARTDRGLTETETGVHANAFRHVLGKVGLGYFAGLAEYCGFGTDSGVGAVCGYSQAAEEKEAQSG